MNKNLNGTDGVLNESPSVQSLRFEHSVRKCLDTMPGHGTMGIGTLSEKRMHAVIKHFICDDKSCHEIRLNPGEQGSKAKKYVADVLIGNRAYEVQTGSFSALKDKIRYYLEETPFDVTVIHPLVRDKWINKLDPESGEIVSRRKSPEHERPEDILYEVYNLKDFLNHPRLHIAALIVDAEEFRFDVPRRRRRGDGMNRKYDIIPTKWVQTLLFERPEDFLIFVPEDLPEVFTKSELKACAHVSDMFAYGWIRTMEDCGLLVPDEKRGRSQSYRFLKEK